MITVEEATRLICQDRIELATEKVALPNAIGRLLAEPLLADRDFPPFHRVTMDGIAIHFSAFEAGNRSFAIEAMQTAGMPVLSLQNAHHAVEVMTGAVLPIGTDTVIRYEDLEIQDNLAKLAIPTITKGQNIHPQGSDKKAGELLVPQGRMLSAAEIGIAATIGKPNLLVKKLPEIAMISTGDEIVPVDKTPLPHQIRSSNASAIAALLSKWHINVETFHLPDQSEKMAAALAGYLQKFDAILLTGGVSEGKLDYVPGVLAALGVEKIFHKVQQKPGKPLWFGKSKEGTTVFALPGNPVSALMCAVRYVEPWLRANLSLPPIQKEGAILKEEVLFKPDLTYFVQVQLEKEENGCLWAKPIEGKGSGDLANLVAADGFLELPAAQTTHSSGAVYPLWKYRSE